MIDITVEKLLTLSKAAQLLPARRKGKRPHPATLYRWAAKGIGDVKLEVVRVGCTTCTSVQALRRFCDRLTLADRRLVNASATNPSIAAEGSDIERQLDEMGL